MPGGGGLIYHRQNTLGFYRHGSWRIADYEPTKAVLLLIGEYSLSYTIVTEQKVQKENKIRILNELDLIKVQLPKLKLRSARVLDAFVIALPELDLVDTFLICSITLLGTSGVLVTFSENGYCSRSYAFGNIWRPDEIPTRIVMDQGLDKVIYLKLGPLTIVRFVISCPDGGITCSNVVSIRHDQNVILCHYNLAYPPLSRCRSLLSPKWCESDLSRLLSSMTSDIEMPPENEKIEHFEQIEYYDLDPLPNRQVEETLGFDAGKMDKDRNVYYPIVLKSGKSEPITIGRAVLEFTLRAVKLTYLRTDSDDSEAVGAAKMQERPSDWGLNPAASNSMYWMEHVMHDSQNAQFKLLMAVEERDQLLSRESVDELTIFHHSSTHGHSLEIRGDPGDIRKFLAQTSLISCVKVTPFGSVSLKAPRAATYDVLRELENHQLELRRVGLGAGKTSIENFTIVNSDSHVGSANGIMRLHGGGFIYGQLIGQGPVTLMPPGHGLRNLALSHMITEGCRFECLIGIPVFPCLATEQREWEWSTPDDPVLFQMSPYVLKHAACAFGSKNLWCRISPNGTVWMSDSDYRSQEGTTTRIWERAGCFKKIDVLPTRMISVIRTGYRSLIGLGLCEHLEVTHHCNSWNQYIWISVSLEKGLELSSVGERHYYRDNVISIDAVLLEERQHAVAIVELSMEGETTLLFKSYIHRNGQNETAVEVLEDEYSLRSKPVRQVSSKSLCSGDVIYMFEDEVVLYNPYRGCVAKERAEKHVRCMSCDNGELAYIFQDRVILESGLSLSIPGNERVLGIYQDAGKVTIVSSIPKRHERMTKILDGGCLIQRCWILKQMNSLARTCMKNVLCGSIKQNEPAGRILYLGVLDDEGYGILRCARNIPLDIKLDHNERVVAIKTCNSNQVVWITHHPSLGGQVYICREMLGDKKFVYSDKELIMKDGILYQCIGADQNMLLVRDLYNNLLWIEDESKEERVRESWESALLELDLKIDLQHKTPVDVLLIANRCIVLCLGQLVDIDMENEAIYEIGLDHVYTSLHELNQDFVLMQSEGADFQDVYNLPDREVRNLDETVPIACVQPIDDNHVLALTTQNKLALITITDEQLIRIPFQYCISDLFNNPSPLTFGNCYKRTVSGRCWTLYEICDPQIVLGLIAYRSDFIVWLDYPLVYDRSKYPKMVKIPETTSPESLSLEMSSLEDVQLTPAVDEDTMDETTNLNAKRRSNESYQKPSIEDILECLKGDGGDTFSRGDVSKRVRVSEARCLSLPEIKEYVGDPGRWIYSGDYIDRESFVMNALPGLQMAKDHLTFGFLVQSRAEDPAESHEVRMPTAHKLAESEPVLIDLHHIRQNGWWSKVWMELVSYLDPF